jgi:hypothetical protein
VIESILKSLTAVGSFLGTIAFIQNISKEVTATNKAQWEKLAALIAAIDFDELQNDIEIGRIQFSIREKMHGLAYAIEKGDYSIMGFKSLFRNRIRQKLLEWHGLYKIFQQHVQVPYWNPERQYSDTDVLWEAYVLDKELFYKDLSTENLRDALRVADKRLAAHRETILTIAEKMEALFIDIQRLANRDPFEYILPWKW